MSYGSIDVTQPFPRHRMLEARPRGDASISSCSKAISALVNERLESAGAIRLRGFEVDRTNFGTLAAMFGNERLSYDYGSTPRTDLGDKIYTATEYPRERDIPFHNEQSYTKRWPMRLCFLCTQAPEEGGETPLADSRVVYDRLPAAVRKPFEDKGVMYIRNYHAGIDVPWQKVFGTEDCGEVERFCDKMCIGWQWMSDGVLRTTETCQGTAVHPRSGEKVWFNQATLFHPSSLPADTREALTVAFEPDELPRSVRFGDGTEIDESTLREIDRVYEEVCLEDRWEQGDVIVLDNMLWAHARRPYQGTREVLVSLLDQVSVEEMGKGVVKPSPG